MSNAIFHFRTKLEGVPEIDKQNCIIKGVTVITSGVTAKGHDLEVDDTTVEQIVECGRKAKKVQMKYDHKSGVTAIGGHLTNFRVENGKGKADLHLLKSHEETAKTIEKAETMPECFGLSAAFAGPEKGEKVGKKFAARCTELLAVDCVTSPAANPTGLFSAKGVDTPEAGNLNTMDPEELKKILAEALKPVNEAITGLTDRLTAIEEATTDPSAEELGALLNDDKALLAEMEKQGVPADQLEQVRANVQATYDALYGDPASGEGADDPANAPSTAVKPGAQPTATSQSAVTSTAAAAALAAIRPHILNFERRQEEAAAAAEQAVVEQAFETLDKKVTELSELVAQKDTQIIALQEQLKRKGGGAAAPSAESLRLFSAEEGAEGVLEFETLCTKELAAVKAADPKLNEFQAKARAQDHVIRRNPEVYADWCREKGLIK